MKKLQVLLFSLGLSCYLFLSSGCQPQVLTQKISQSSTIKITLWHGINPPENRDVFNQLVTKFNQTHPDIEVEALYIGQSDTQLPKIFAATVSEQPPDLLWFIAQITGKLAQLDALLPLEDWLDRSSIRQEIDPAMFPTMELNGHILSVPFATNNLAVFYRPSLFEQAGITNLPQTWQELKTVAQQLTQDTDGDRRIDQHGILLSLGKEEWTVFTWLPFIYSAGGELLTDNRPNLVNQGAIKALEFGADLIQSDLAVLSAPERGYELDSFLKGSAAMQITGPWTLGQLQETNTDYGVFPIPADKTQTTVIGGENLFVFKTTPERQRACLKFLEYILGEEFQTEWALKTGYLPINLKSQQNPVYQQFIAENPVLEVFLNQMKTARSRPVIAKYNRLSENLGRAIEAVLLGKETPETALTKSQQRLELIFRN